MRWAQFAVDTLRTIAWPMVVLVISWRFGDTLKTKLADLLRVRAGNVAEFEFTRPVAPPSAENGPSPEKDAPRGLEGAQPGRAPSFSRTDIESMIKDAVRWGYERAGEASVPNPIILWTKPGRPRLADRAVTVRFEVYTDVNGMYRFRAKASNGEILMVSEAHPNEVMIRQAINRLGSGRGVRPTVYRDKSGRFRFRISDSLGEVLAVSEVFETRDAADQALQRLGYEPPDQVETS